MRNVFILLLVSVLSLHVADCNAQIKASKKYVTKNITVQDVKNLTVTGSHEVVYTQTNGSKTEIEIYASDNIIPLLETAVENNTLAIRYKKNTLIRNSGEVKIKISGPALENIKVQGSGKLTLANGMKATKLYMKVQGSGDLYGKNILCDALDVNVQGSGDLQLEKVSTETINARVAGSGDLHLSGTSNRAAYNVQGSGDIKAAELKCNDVEAKAQGSGGITCHAVKTLTGSVQGSGNVAYKGDPQINIYSKKGFRKL